MDETTTTALQRFATEVQAAFGDALVSVTLFGSAAEDRLRASSDVNVAVVLRRFDPDAAVALREPLRLASAALRLRVMIVLEDELPAAAEAFAVKLADIRRRHRVLAGDDPFARLVVPRAAALARLAQVLLNLELRLREQWISNGLYEERLSDTIAETAGPLRACAAELLELEGVDPPAPREALERVAGRALPAVSEARERGRLRAGVAGPALLELLAVVHEMRSRTSRLAEMS